MEIPAAVGAAVDYLHALYHALISIQVPSEKARAVVDAMERDMGTTLATKQDLLLIRQEIENRYELLSREIGSLRTDMDKGFSSLRSDVAKDLQGHRGEVAKDMQILRSDFGKDMEALRLSMTVRLGSMLVLGLGVSVSVILGTLRLWL